MQVELTGKVINVLQPLSGQGSKGSWMKNQFVIEWQDNGYTQKLCLEVMGEDKWEKMKSSVVVGNDVNVRFSVSSREYQGRWFTSASCFYCIGVGGSNAQQQNVNNGSARQQTSVQQQQQAQETQKSDDLPF